MYVPELRLQEHVNWILEGKHLLIFSSPKDDWHLGIFEEHYIVTFRGVEHAKLERVLDLLVLATDNLEDPDCIEALPNLVLWLFLVLN